MDCVIKAPWGEHRLPHAALRLLELDAGYSVYGERLAGLLLAPFRVDCGGSGEERVLRAASAYRRRVVAEQLYELAVKAGPLSREVEVRASYAPVSRMSLLSRLHGCRYEEALRSPGLGGLEAEYAPLTSGLAEEAGGGWYRLRPPALREAVRGLMAAFRQLGAAAAARTPAPSWAPEPCPPRGPPRELVEPWTLSRLPEGALVPLGLQAAEAASRLLGGPVECRSGGRIASTLICEGPRGRVAVKEYYRMALKWVPAAAVGAAYIRYRVTPKSRLAGEYRYLRLLRPIAGTPRVLLVSVDYNHASMAREFVEGRPVLGSGEAGDWRLAGEALAAIHRAGYVVGDPNPGNFIVGDGGRARLIDAEQARGYSVRAAAWDLAVFSAYARVSGAPLELVEEALKAYREAVGAAWGSVARVFASRSLWLNLSIAPRTALELHRLASRLAGAGASVA